MTIGIRTNGRLAHLDVERIKRRGDKPMTGREMVDEFEFLLDNGTHPLLAAEMLGISYAYMTTLTSRHGRTGLCSRIDIGEIERHSLPERSGWGYAA